LTKKARSEMKQPELIKISVLVGNLWKECEGFSLNPKQWQL